MKKIKRAMVYLAVISLLLQGYAGSASVAMASESQETDVTEEIEVTEETEETGQTSSEEESLLEEPDVAEIDDITLMTGGMPELDLTPPEGEEGNFPDEPDRASAKSLIKNKGKFFYYTDQLTAEEQVFSDAIYSVLKYPDDTSWNVTMYTTVEPATEAFYDVWDRACTALMHDHPELFWYYGPSCGNLRYSYYLQPNEDGEYRITLYLSSPYKKYKKEMKAFNKATKEFLSKIDKTKSDACIALQVHNQLLDLCTYDYRLLNNPSSDDYGYTAYGALVKNGAGEKNSCVCAGYAAVYEYLLQQLGIPCIYISGYAGSDKSSMGSHAWNLVKLDGKWYEVDVTWDDNTYDSKSEFKKSDLGKAMVNDAGYWNRITHRYFCLTTEQINNCNDGDSFYYSAAGYYWTPRSSVRRRDKKKEDPVVYTAPKATGTTYYQSRNCEK